MPLADGSHVQQCLFLDPEVGKFILADTNHLNVSKPTSRQSSIYQQTLSFIRDLTSRVEESDSAEFIYESSFLDF